MAWITSHPLAVSDVVIGWLVGIYVTIAIIAMFLILLGLGIENGAGGEGLGLLALGIGLFWPLLLPFWLRHRSSRNAPGASPPAAAPVRTETAKSATRSTLPPPSSAGSATSGPRNAAIITPTAGQRCERCGNRLVPHDTPRAWGKGAVCGGCAADLGVAG